MLEENLLYTLRKQCVMQSIRVSSFPKKHLNNSAFQKKKKNCPTSTRKRYNANDQTSENSDVRTTEDISYKEMELRTFIRQKKKTPPAVPVEHGAIFPRRI